MYTVLVKLHLMGLWVSSDPNFTSPSHNFYGLLPQIPLCPPPHLHPPSVPSHLLTSGIHPIFIFPNKPATCPPLCCLIRGACGHVARITVKARRRKPLLSWSVSCFKILKNDHPLSDSLVTLGFYHQLVL